MSQDESCQVRQNNELEVLKSIFGNELRDLRTTKQKKKWHPLDILITLTPQQGMSGPAVVYAQVDLHVTCSNNYPQESPKIQLKNSRGVSHQQLAIHLSELENLAEKLKGEVMIFELCQRVQTFLHEHNKPGYSSCYEEMVLTQQERRKVELQEKQLKADKERQVLQDEILKRQQALKTEMRHRRESTRLSLESDAILSQSIPSSPLEKVRTYSRRRCMSTSESSEGSLCEHRGTKLIHFDNNKGERQVYRGKCLGHSTKGSIVYSGVDMITGELLAITEWVLKCGKSKSNLDIGETSDLQHTMKQIASIEQELNHLYKLHHANLVHYLNMKYLQDKDNNIIIYTLQEFVVGTTCSFYLTESIPVAADMLRYLTLGIVSALEYLHENNVVHKDLRDSSVHIDKTGVIRLSDYSLNKRLSDIYQSSGIAKVEHDFPTIQGRGGKKADIYRLGILLLSLLKGSIVTQKEMEIDLALPPDLKDFLSKCLDDNERSRWSAEQLLQHDFLRTPIERGLTPPKQDGNEKKNVIEPEEEPDADVQFYLPAFGGQSRIQNEFEVLKWLGKGAFGDVLKVKNKLDGGIYAIKRIELNPKKKHLNKKITREVKLLSRLNHENVVRYYNSWIESAKVDDDAIHSRLTPSTTPSINLRSIVNDKTSSVDDDFGNSNIEKLAPPMREVEWNISYESRASAAISTNGEQGNRDHSSDESDSDDEGWAFISMAAKSDSSSGGIEFERDETSQATTDSAQNSQDLDKTKQETEDGGAPSNEIQFMYIQMEFCEKSTLRTAIDNGLHDDDDRIWRLFREIIEGLVHIHQQGMIHRDLKPVNIFLDSNDHVKIGDFGLATTNILSAFNQTFETETAANDRGSFETDDLESMTGQVGTALYVAPELSQQVVKAIYNQKVDIYSLGIIFFEMLYKPLKTGMERVKVLMNLRSKEIIIPDELALDWNMSNKIQILRWLLNHDPSQRPTSQELLSSKLLPAPRLEEAQLQKIVSHTLSNVQSKAYKYLISSCFSQEWTAADDVTYDMNMSAKGVPNFQKLNPFQENIKSKVVEVFEKHGGVCFTTPLLMPKSGPLYSQTDTCVRVMTRNGNIVTIPHDLRAPFARYVARNNISNIRRYSIERVYREKKISGFHPRELYECAYDIISPTANNLMSEAELIYIAWEICNEIPHLQERNFAVRINHTSLLQAVLMYCGIEREKHHDILSILCDARDGEFTRFQVQTHLISLCLTDQAMETLFNLFETENSVAKINSVLKTITKRKGDSAALAKKGLGEIDEVTSHIYELGVKWPVTVLPLLVHNINQHSGIIYQITCEMKRRKKRNGQEVIAAGGRYDKMLSSFREVLERTNFGGKTIKQYGVGISISLDKLACTLSEVSEEELYRNRKFAIDVAVCCVDEEPRRRKELAEILSELWTLGLKAMSLDFHTSEEILEYCRESSINQVIMLKTGEKGHLRIQTWERDRYQERKISICDMADQFQRQSENVAPITLNRSESKISANSEVNVSSTPHNVNINFVLSERDKLSGSGRRSYKNTITAQLSSYMQRISPKVPIEVFGVFLEMTVIRTITNFLETDVDEQTFQKSVQVVIDKHPRHKKYIKQICDKMWEVRTDKSRPVLILYSLTDSGYVTLL